MPPPSFHALTHTHTPNAHRVYTNFRAQNPDVPPAKIAMLSTAVSSKALAAMAAAEGFHFEETLTGVHMRKFEGEQGVLGEQQSCTGNQ